MPLGPKRFEGATVGVTVPVGPGEIRASYGQVAFRYPGDRSRASKIALGYVHHLSKRTALYATVARISNSNGAAAALTGAITAPNRSSSGTEFGMRHMF